MPFRHELAKNTSPNLRNAGRKDRIFRNLPFEGSLEAVDFVDPFAAKRAFFEQILVDVGNRERIGIEPIGARKGALEQRTFATDGQ